MIGFEESDDEDYDDHDTLRANMVFDRVFGFENDLEKQFKLKTFEEDHARASLADTLWNR